MNAPIAKWRARLRIAFGAAVSMVASVGLVCFGPGTIRVLGIVTWKPEKGVDPPTSGLMLAAILAAAFGGGLTLVSIGYIRVAACAATSAAGRWLLGLSGIATVCSAMVILLGASQAFRMFNVVGSSEAQMKVPEVLTVVTQATGRAQIGFSVLVVAQALLLAASVFGVSDDSPRAGTFNGVRIVAIASALCALLFALLFVLTWIFHGQAVEGVFTHPAVPVKATEIAGHLSSILGNSLAAAVWLALHGVFQTTVAFLLPGKSHAASP